MRNKLWRHITTCVLSLAMVASTMVFSTGCSGTGDDIGGGSETIDPKNLIQLDVVSTRANFAGEQAGWMGRVLAEKFGVKFNIIKGDEVTLSINLQSGDMGDLIIWGAGNDTYMKAAELGYLLDFESGSLLENFAPYIKEHCQTDLQNMKQYSNDGKAYAIAGGVSTTAEGIQTFFYNWDVRWDLYEKLGCPEVKNLDDLYDLFVKMKEIYPTNDAGQETYALSLWSDWDGDMVMYAKCLAQAYYGLEGDYVPGLYDNRTGTYYDIANEDGPYYEMIRFLNKLYTAGLLDPNSSTQTYDEAVQKLKSDRVFFSLFNYSGSTAYNTSEHLAAGKAMYSLVPTEAHTIVYGLSETGVAGQSFSIGANTEYPDKVLEILNWMYTPEGRLTTEYGPKELCWTYTDEGKTTFTKLGAALHDDTSLQFGDLYSYTDAEGIQHIVSESAVKDGKFTANVEAVTDENGNEVSAAKTVEYDVELYYELPSEFEAYRGMKFSDGTNEMNNITWDLATINPESGERFDCLYWASTIAAKATTEIEQKWKTWAAGQAGREVRDCEDYLETTNYRVYLTLHTKSDNMDTDLKTTYKQITGSKTGKVCVASWNAILSSSAERCDLYLAGLITDVNKFGKDGKAKSYADIVEWAKGQCEIRYGIEQEFLAAHPGLFD